MSKITREEVARIADLSRISLTEEQLDRFANELDVVLESVAAVSQAVPADTPSTSHPIPLTNVTRPDEPEAPLDRDTVLTQAPDAEDGYFKVPQILGEE